MPSGCHAGTTTLLTQVMERRRARQPLWCTPLPGSSMDPWIGKQAPADQPIGASDFSMGGCSKPLRTCVTHRYAIDNSPYSTGVWTGKLGLDNDPCPPWTWIGQAWEP